MHIHILGICGTFMAGVAQLARGLGVEVSGSDANAWPPMSEQLEAAGIAIRRGYAAAHLEPAPDQVVIGNALSRGNAAVEHVLDARLPYTSGPAWLAEHVLQRRPVLAIAGTHGKTTTSSLLAFILERAGLEPGYLIGGVAPSLGTSARLGAAGAPFVIEADEYDSAFFDKRSKFVHYRPSVLVMNNLEFDHADIFDDMTAIRRQFHHLIRTVPANGNVLSAFADAELEKVLAMGCWSQLERFGDAADADWQAVLRDRSGRSVHMKQRGGKAVKLDWRLAGRHNALNALAAVAAAAKVGVSIETACEALTAFEGIRRRLELRGEASGVMVYDDFAHHPTAIAATLETLRALDGSGRIIALIDPVSNTMRMGVHKKTLGPALAHADRVLLLDRDNLQWDPHALEAGPSLRSFGAQAKLSIHPDVADMIDAYVPQAQAGDRVVAMSNAAFGGIHERLLARLRERT